MNGPSPNGFQGDFLRGALDVAPEGVLICEAGGERNVVYVNPAFCRLTGYELNELIGKNPRFLQGDDQDQPELETVREALRHGEAVRALLRNQRKDGTVFVNDMQIYPLKDGERQGHALHRLSPRRRYAQQGGGRERHSRHPAMGA